VEIGPEQKADNARFLLFRTVKAKLLIVFCLIVGLGIAIGSIGWRGFSVTEEALKSLREKSLPDLGNAMELGRRSAGIAGIAPFIASIEIMSKLNAEAEKLDLGVAEFRASVDALEPSAADGGKPQSGSLRDLAQRLEADLRDLVQNTREGLGVRSDMLEIRYAFKNNAAIEKWLRDNATEIDDSGRRLEAFRRLIETILTVPGSNSITSLNELEARYAYLAGSLHFDSDRPEIAAGATELKAFVETQSRVFGLRRRELEGREQNQYLLASIHALSALLSNRVSEVALETMQRSKATSAQTDAALENGKYRIVALIVISLLVGLAAASYVLRNLAGNLQAVTAAMSRLAGGDRTTSVPAMDRVDELGSLARAFNIFKEQSFDRERLAADLIEKSRTLEATFTNMTDGMSVFDSGDRLVAWNPQFIEINELDPAHIHPGMHFGEIFEQLSAAGMKLAVGDGRDDSEELIHRMRTNPIAHQQCLHRGRLVEFRSVPMEGGFAMMYTDLTERRAMEEQLRQAQRMEAVGRLASGTAHDFNNILAAVTGSLQILQEALHDRPDLAPRVLRSLEAAERGATLTQRLLAFSRQQALEPEMTNLNALVRGLLDLLDYDLGKGISIETALDEPLDEAPVDPAQLENAILNLIFNSCDALQDGGSICLRTSNRVPQKGAAADRFVSIAVSDNGIGMTTEVAMRAFEPFFTTKEKGRGSGLGLSMVYGFVSQSGGEVEVLSKPGVGTTVTLILPKIGASVQPRRRTTPLSLADTVRGNAERVLIVEDDRIMRETAVDILSNLGYTTSVAENLERAKDQLDTWKFDLVFTDYMLPDGKTGVDVATYLKQISPDTAILYISGHPLDKLRQDPLLSMEAVVIAKPFRRQELAAAIRQLIDSRN